ncbi:hypothetical protein BB561_003123 [Smittium simulii]|uniref:RAD50-interacting protein 1 n=1 Tax=Smittium simulii TaxID=133385 RepID=A0A2T9YMT1_9FUNG|nr:hypothetical protein BB561_003123 [Smittium simulii]
MNAIQDDSITLSFLDAQFPNIDSLDSIQELHFSQKKVAANLQIQTIKNTLTDLNLKKNDKESSFCSESEHFRLVQKLKEEVHQLQILQATSSLFNVIKTVNHLEKKLISELKADLSDSIAYFISLSSLCCRILYLEQTIHSKKLDSTLENVTLLNGNILSNLNIIEYIKEKLKLNWARMIDFIVSFIQDIVSTSWLSDDIKKQYPSNKHEMNCAINSTRLFKSTFQKLDIKIKQIILDWDTSDLSKKWNSELCLSILLESVSAKFNYHFRRNTSTNRIDKPEWALTFLLKESSKLIGFIENDVQKNIWKKSPNGKNASDQFISGIIKIIGNKLLAENSLWITAPELVPHLLDELAKFDLTLQEIYLYGVNQDFKGIWVGTAEIWMTKSKEVLEAWRNLEYEDAREKYLIVRRESYAFDNNVKGADGSIEMAFVSPLSIRMGSIIESLTEKISKLRKLSWKYVFASTVVFPLINSYIEHLDAEIDNFKRVSVAFLQNIPNFRLNTSSDQNLSLDFTKDSDSKILSIIDSLGLKPLVSRLRSISGFLYSSSHFRDLLSEFSDVELWVELWAWCCKIKSNSKIKKDLATNQILNDINDELADPNQFQLYTIDDIEKLNPSDLEYVDSGFCSEVERTLSKVDLSSLSKTKHMQVEKSIFGDYMEKFNTLTSTSLNLFKMVFNKEILVLLKQYENATYLRNQQIILNNGESGDLDIDDANFNNNIVDFQKNIEVSGALIPILRAVSIVLNYTVNNLLQPLHYITVIKDMMIELDNWIVTTVIVRNTWSIDKVIQFSIDLKAIISCFKASLSSQKSYLGYFSKYAAILPQSMEALYLLALPISLDANVDTENWCQFADLPRYYAPSEITKIVINMFYCEQQGYGLDTSPLLKQVSGFSSFSNSGINTAYRLKPFSKEDNQLVIERLKEFEITHLTPARAGMILQTRTDSEIFFKE